MERCLRPYAGTRRAIAGAGAARHAQSLGAPGSFSSDDAYRALDSVHRLLLAVSAPQAEEIEKAKMELLRVRFDEQARGARRKSAGTAVESQVTGSLKPWRELRDQAT